jgi:hypothetical protein
MPTSHRTDHRVASCTAWWPELGRLLGLLFGVVVGCDVTRRAPLVCASTLIPERQEPRLSEPIHA